jgi:hypothetical protein
VSFSLFWGPARGQGFRGRHHPLEQYAFGLWRAVHAARAAGWGVCVYHDGSVEAVLDRFRAAFPPPWPGYNWKGRRGVWQIIPSGQ